MTNDEEIVNICTIISENITEVSHTNLGLASQNMLAQLRHLVEHVIVKIDPNSVNPDPNSYEEITRAKASLLKYDKKKKYSFLFDFLALLAKTESHYSQLKDASERLMRKYMSYLARIKSLLKTEYGMDVLDNLDDYPRRMDESLKEYYKKISERIEKGSEEASFDKYKFDGVYYVSKNAEFWVNGKLYFQITFETAAGRHVKADHLIAFTRIRIFDDYALKFRIHSDFISVYGKRIPILIIDDYEISIRPVEFSTLSQILGVNNGQFKRSNAGYRPLMNFIKENGASLTEILSYDQSQYSEFRTIVSGNKPSNNLLDVLDKARTLIRKKLPGSNVLRYLTLKMNLEIMRKQSEKAPCKYLSNLYLKYDCIPFDTMPFCSSLSGHNPEQYDVLESVSPEGRTHEFLAHRIKVNTEKGGHLFTPLEELQDFQDIPKLIDTYNSKLYYKHKGRKIRCFKSFYYIDEYVQSTETIIDKLKAMASNGIPSYSKAFNSWLGKTGYFIDDDEKRAIVSSMFEKTGVALIYGPAGTGKSTLIRHVASFFENQRKCFIASTNAAVKNLQRKITVKESTFSTISKFLQLNPDRQKCDVLFIDECSTIDNRDMLKILNSAKFQLIVLVGDVYQIGSPNFGNWFHIAKVAMPSFSVFELTTPHRTENKKLLSMWKAVRNMDSDITEQLVTGGFVDPINNSIFDHSNDDEIILCLNYDGLYGINNINRMLQAANPNDSVYWNEREYKVGDPIIFNESSPFSPLIANNTKGKIRGVFAGEDKITFDIELDGVLNPLDARFYDFKMINEPSEKNTVIEFSVPKYRSNDETDDAMDSRKVPFQVSYALSIHKAQGLEFKSVKIIITKESGEMVTHDIFYTAITRAREQLKIYWSADVQELVLKSLKKRNLQLDVSLLRELRKQKA